MIGNPRCHRRRNSEALVNSAKVVKREPAGDSGPMVLPFLAEGVREARESAIAHARAQVIALYNRGANTLGIRLAEDWALFRRSYLSRAISAFAFASGSVDLDGLREAGEPIMQRGRDARFVRGESIGCDLESGARSSLVKSFNEDVRCCMIHYKLA